MHLAVMHRQRAELVAFGAHRGRGGVGVEPAAQKHDRLHVRRLASQASRCTCGSAAEDGRRACLRGSTAARLLGVENPVDRRKQHRADAAGQPVADHDVARELVVLAVLDHELHFVLRGEALDVRPVVSMGLSAAWALDVHDADHRGRDLLDTEVTAGLEHHGEAFVEQPLHQRIDILLQQRLSAGDLDDGAFERLDPFDHLVERHLVSLGECVRRVAPGAAEVARRQADEHAGPPRVRRFSLDRVEDLVDGQHSSIVRLTTPNSQSPKNAWELEVGIGS